MADDVPKAPGGDLPEEFEEDIPLPEADFKKNSDIGGDEAALSGPSAAAGEDFTRGSGYLGEAKNIEAARKAIEGARKGAKKSVETARHDQEAGAVGGYAAGETGISETAGGPSAASPTSDLESDIEDTENLPGDRRAPSPGSQGRDIGPSAQVTGVQRFGRDVGSQGLSQGDAEGDGSVRMGKKPSPERRDWTAVLGRLGGASPGSEDNLAIGAMFGKVQFPASREEVLGKLPPVAEYRFREGITVDLRHAVASSRKEIFRMMNELIDCVKEELRRAEKPHAV